MNANTQSQTQKAWVKIKYQNKTRIITGIYNDREEAVAEWNMQDAIIQVNDIEKYKKQTEQWNESIRLINSGVKIIPILKQKKENWSYDQISEAGKAAIENAMRHSIDQHWMIVMKFHIEEQWSDENFCCSIQLPQFKEKVYSMMNLLEK